MSSLKQSLRIVIREVATLLGHFDRYICSCFCQNVKVAFTDLCTHAFLWYKGGVKFEVRETPLRARDGSKAAQEAE